MQWWSAILVCNGRPDPKGGLGDLTPGVFTSSDQHHWARRLTVADRSGRGTVQWWSAILVCNGRPDPKGATPRA